MPVTIWHNPRCSKSRETLALVEDKEQGVIVRKYLEDAPDATEIRAALAMLGIGARDLMRTKEALYKDLGLDGISDEDKLIDVMAANPKLIERPVVFKDGKARLGRPPEAVLEIL
ncbi:arsenate reductase [Cohaesibacter sp. ES.047]|uniref:arsenate reductase (glutaredoxin) n=1 Tax=Cohaesibacter sp. ES.047 TaxID=1798205 RepID=UPI000BB906D6|nr:arsenate reductase (glutaredoxin) [Cohaesibacter sp. ES.047]SNY91905.1 arsenate reductase [Cohaesibacter sp. ES.047]